MIFIVTQSSSFEADLVAPEWLILVLLALIQTQGYNMDCMKWRKSSLIDK